MSPQELEFVGLGSSVAYVTAGISRTTSLDYRGSAIGGGLGHARGAHLTATCRARSAVSS